MITGDKPGITSRATQIEGLKMMSHSTIRHSDIAPLVELSDAEVDAVCGGQTSIIAGLANVFANVAANVAALNVTVGSFSQTTGAQSISIS
jgi:hypothetical protein